MGPWAMGRVRFIRWAQGEGGMGRVGGESGACGGEEGRRGILRGRSSGWTGRRWRELGSGSEVGEGWAAGMGRWGEEDSPDPVGGLSGQGVFRGRSGGQKSRRVRGRLRLTGKPESPGVVDGGLLRGDRRGLSRSGGGARGLAGGIGDGSRALPGVDGGGRGGDRFPRLLDIPGFRLMIRLALRAEQWGGTN